MSCKVERKSDRYLSILNSDRRFWQRVGLPVAAPVDRLKSLRRDR
jgi:hypothetical protein